MMSIGKPLCALACASVLSGCASGVPVSESSVAQEPVPAGKSRIAVYRTNLFGAAIQPVIDINGKTTGRCTPQGVFYVDVEPGQQSLSATTEVTKTSYLSVDAGQTAYVKCSIGFGLLIGQPRLDVVSTSIGRTDTQKLKVTGKY